MSLQNSRFEKEPLNNARKLPVCWVTDRSALEVAPGTSREGVLLARIREATLAGLDWIQLREKDLETPQLEDLARNAVSVSRNTGTRILINDRLDLALADGAGGVHLGENSLPVADVARSLRANAARDFLVGASCHSLERAVQSAADGADYIFFGPVFATPSKASYGPPQGLARLEQVCRAISIPVLAIGGITERNAAACLAAGAAGIAAIRLFQEAPDLAALLQALR